MNSHKKIPPANSLLSEMADNAKFKKNIFIRASEKFKSGVGLLAFGTKEKIFDFSNVLQMKNEALTFVEYQDPRTHELKTDIYINPSSKALQAGVFDWGTIFTVLLQPFSSAFYTASQGFTLESVAVGAAGVGSYFYGKKFVKKITVRGRLDKNDREMLKLLVEDGTLGSIRTGAFASRILESYVGEKIQGISSIADNLGYEAKRGSNETTYRHFIETSDLGDKSKTSRIQEDKGIKSTISRETYAPLEVADQELAIKTRIAEIKRVIISKRDEIINQSRTEGIQLLPADLPNINKYLDEKKFISVLKDLHDAGITDPAKIAESLSLEIGTQLGSYRDKLKTILSEEAHLPPRISAIFKFEKHLLDKNITAKIQKTFNADFDKLVMQTGEESISGEIITKLRLKAVWKHMPDDFKSYFMKGRGPDEAFELFYSSARETNLLIQNEGVILKDGKWQGFFNKLADFWNDTAILKRLKMNPTAVRSAISNHLMAGVVATAVLFLAPVGYSIGEWGYKAATSAFQRDITPEAAEFLASPTITFLLEKNQYPKTLELLNDDDVVNYIATNPTLKMRFQEVGTYQLLEENPKTIEQILDNPSAALKLLEQLKKNLGMDKQEVLIQKQITNSAQTTIRISSTEVIDGNKVREIIKNGFDLYSDVYGHYITAPLQDGSIKIGEEKTFTSIIVASGTYDIGFGLQPKVNGRSVDGGPYSGPNHQGLIFITAGDKDNFMGICKPDDKLKITTTVNFGQTNFTYTHHVENLTTKEPIDDKTVVSDYNKSPAMRKVRDNPGLYEYTIGVWVSNSDYSKIK